ncbi:MAG: CotH kinase family protein [Candidatus Zixiibacteriota bacterium]
MSKTFFLVLTLVLLTVTARGQDFYDINAINTIEITFQESNWDQILDTYYALGDEERLVGSAVINGIPFDSVGVRYKGFSSYNPNRVKNPLNIKLDYIIDDQKYDGYGTFKLANCWSDPSFVREVLAYEIARQYMPAGKANYMKVTINGTYIGLYTNVQDVDKYFAQMHDYDDNGARFKAVLENGIMSFQPPIWGYLGSDSSSYFDYFELESDSASDWDALINFFYEYNYNPYGMEAVLNFDRHLWKLAFEILLVNLDGPVNESQNYYLFQDHLDRFNPILWDLNMSFGGFTQLRSTNQNLTVYQMQHLSPLLNLGDGDYPIINNVLSIETYRKMYLAHMKTILNENFLGNNLATRGGEIQNIIAAEVQADPNKFYTYNDFLNNLNYSVGQTVGITQLMNGRVLYLAGLSFYTDTPPIIANISYTPETITAGSTVNFTVNISNASSVILGYRQSVYNSFNKAVLYDDGAHNDGASGDGLYGALVDIGNGDIQYYIYAENNNVGIFSPARAEYEYYTAAVTGASPTILAINELMADNDNIFADQDGEYDDWLEIYNLTDSTVSVNGYYLTDDISNMLQWAFPDTSITPGGYLLIWADDDTEQVGLHANFKLSASGEVIILSSPLLETIDLVYFDGQATDISHGRCPDGIDNWMFFSAPTPENENSCFICGDINNDQMVNILDITSLIAYLYKSGTEPNPLESADVNSNGILNILDVTYLIAYLYKGGPEPDCP